MADETALELAIRLRGQRWIGLMLAEILEKGTPVDEEYFNGLWRAASDLDRLVFQMATDPLA